MLRLGLTGSIAAGKSTVLDMIAARGIPTISSDAIVHRLYEGPAVQAVEELFPGIVRDGLVDRAELSRRLVASPERLADLEAVIHPMVRTAIAGFFADAEAAGAPLAVADIPLLFESSFDYGLDEVIVVAVEPSIQRQRALARPGMSETKLQTILARQLPQQEKVKRADHVIDTSLSLDDTRRSVESLLDSLLSSPAAP